MIRATDKVMEAFSSGPGRTIAEFLEACREAKKDECTESEGVQLGRAQGAAMELKELIELAKTSRERL